ncbi:uncharacterized protein LY89DRAFT_622311 [Mollisia scopiformis]|uniref:Zn(2)-C6 fungal-type domain-containing protein n=1 Tax=Mollisia scopiformis TaxID=149040 RepID=A0A194WZR6_MOLSC|nr:uncharacterized protein LY89DRAFT_622311 [Mollisia scopiformis]KUJ13438.1 hypothetical protein LY89DRAFT_622311 [Mollisia scopiformis]
MATNKTDKRGPTGQKRPHRKSRRGCQQCKQAKIKCDEQKPSCGHCSRFQSKCSFLTTTPTPFSASDSSLRSPEASPSTLNQSHDTRCSTASPSAGLITGSGIALDVNNLELLHHYTTTTSITLSARPELQQIWQQVVPRLAFAHNFLLHGILAFSALHLAHLQPERKALLYAEASAHHDLGLHMFQTAMTCITPQNCDACFAFSSIIAAYAWASSNETGDLFFSDLSTSEVNVEWVSLLRGVHTLLQVAGEWMTNGPMSLMLQDRHIDPELANAVDSEVSAKLIALRQLCFSPGLNVKDAEVLEKTLILLQEAHGLIASSSIDHEIDAVLVVYGWPIQVPEAFFTMVKEQRPEALVVLAHYSLLLNKVNQLWYMKGMSRRLLKTIHGKLGKEWESWITWPLQLLVLAEFEGGGDSGGLL